MVVAYVPARSLDDLRVGRLVLLRKRGLQVGIVAEARRGPDGWAKVWLPRRREHVYLLGVEGVRVRIEAPALVRRRGVAHA